MRLTLILIVLACMPAFSQENANATSASEAPAFSGGVPRKLSDALRMKLGYNFDTQAAQTPQKAPAAGILQVMAAKPEGSACSIPLLSVKPPGTPVAMPNMMPKMAEPPSLQPQPGPASQPNRAVPGSGLIDNMKIVVPAPACPADFGRVSPQGTKP